MTNTTVKSAQATIDMCWHFVLLFAVAIVASMLPDLAHASGAAGDGGAISDVLCNIVVAMTGITGKSIATVAVIAIGIGALLGKISWGMALIVAMGVALVFGAATIVSSLGASTTGAACTAGTFSNNAR